MILGGGGEGEREREVKGGGVYTKTSTKTESQVCHQDKIQRKREICFTYFFVGVKHLDFDSASVDDIHDVVNGNRRLSNIGGQNYLPHAWRRSAREEEKIMVSQKQFS